MCIDLFSLHSKVIGLSDEIPIPRYIPTWHQAWPTEKEPSLQDQRKIKQIQNKGQVHQKSLRLRM